MEANVLFGMEEYAVIVSMLVLSLAIGVYYTFWSRQDNYSEYMLGGRKMGVFPVAMSQVASHISGISLVATPAEVYSYGTLFAVAMVADLLAPLINIYLFLPIFYNLQLDSLYEYVELRFSHGTRVLASLIFTISQIIYLPTTIYVPALVFNQVSGLPVEVTAPTICAVCVIYTTFGGLKAVLWTDVLQNLFSLAAVLFILFLGTQKLGGVAEIHRLNEEGGRIEFLNMEFSPFVRNSFWTMIAGNTFVWLCSVAVHPGAVQRNLSLPTLNKAKRALIWMSVGVFMTHCLVISLGMVLYAQYHGCDPVTIGAIKKTGQLMPLYVMEVARGYTGLAGLFVSGVLSAALSTMSSALNTVAGSMYEDLAELFFRGKEQPDAKQSFIMKTISLIVGALCTILVLLVDKTNSIFQLAFSLPGVTYGALLTLFLLGIFIPKANSKGAICGSLASLAVMSWVIGNAYLYMASGKLRYRTKHTSVDQCPGNYSTDPKVLSRLETWRGRGTPVEAHDVPLLYQMSYMYYPALGTLVGVCVGVLVSLATQTPGPPTRSHTDPRLYSPLVHHLLPPPPSVRVAEELELINSSAVLAAKSCP